MAVNAVQPVYWDPYQPEFFHNPYPVFRRLREEAPLWYNEAHGFYALSRYAEVERSLRDAATFSSARGGILEIIKANAELPDAVFIFKDPPVHTMYRSLLQRIITPKRMNALEGQIRSLCAQCLDPLVGTDRFDLIADLGAVMPMKVIGMLLGIPEEDQVAVRQSGDDRLHTEAGKPMDFSMEKNFSGSAYEEYIDWRTTHPSDDIMTELLHAEVKDPTGTIRKLTRDEIVQIVNVVAGAGNETTTRLIGWAGKELSDHPEQRRDLAANPALAAQTIEELLRYQPPGPAIGRYVTRDVEIYGQTIPAGSIMMLLVGAANRDESRFENGETFNIRREQRPHLGFGHGIHVCIGAALARLEGRVALEELIKRFPNWEVDHDNAVLASTSTVRGWETLPLFVGDGRRSTVRELRPTETVVKKDVPLEGVWDLVVKGPTGPQPTVLEIERSGEAYSGSQTGQGSTSAVSDVKVDGNKVSWVNHVTKPMKLKVEFRGEIAGANMTGKAKAGFMGSYSFTAEKR